MLLEEDDEVTEVVFVIKGFYHLGYSIEGKKYFKFLLSRTNIGGYGCLFFKPANYNYKSQGEI